MTKKTDLAIVILYGICAVVWTVLSILEVIVFKTYQDNLLKFIWNVICAIQWVFLFLLSWKRYKNGKR